MIARRLAAALATAFALALIFPARAADLEVGRRLALQCAECHGIDGVSQRPDTPHLAGQNQNYLFKQLYDFRNSEFPNVRHQSVMSYRAPRLGSAATDSLAAWYASQPCPLPEGGAKPAASPPAIAKTCVQCHGDDGRAAGGMMPRLAGQRAEYLLAQLRQFNASRAARRDGREGERDHPLMNEYASRYTDKDFDEIARWYAAQSCR